MKRRENAAIFGSAEHLRKHLDACLGPLKGIGVARRYGRGDKDFSRIVVTSGGFNCYC